MKKLLVSKVEGRATLVLLNEAGEIEEEIASTFTVSGKSWPEFATGDFAKQVAEQEAAKNGTIP